MPRPAKPKGPGSPRSTATGLFVLCPTSHFDGEHRAYVELATHANGSMGLFCRGCTTRVFTRDEASWRKRALTIEQVKRTASWRVIYPLRGNAIIAPPVELP
jgi:hypothetical protein